MVDVRAKGAKAETAAKYLTNDIIDRVNELLEYSPETGIFTYKKLVGNRRAGTIAGSKDAKGYLSLSIDKIKYKAHRVAWLVYYGVWPEGELDHINRVKTDNKISNLRKVTSTQNGINRLVRASTNKTGFMGVTNKGNRYEANIQYNNKIKYLGSFKTAEEASKAYQLALHTYAADYIV